MDEALNGDGSEDDSLATPAGEQMNSSKQRQIARRVALSNSSSSSATDTTSASKKKLSHRQSASSSSSGAHTIFVKAAASASSASASSSSAAASSSPSELRYNAAAVHLMSKDHGSADQFSVAASQVQNQLRAQNGSSALRQRSGKRKQALSDIFVGPESIKEGDESSLKRQHVFAQTPAVRVLPPAFACYLHAPVEENKPPAALAALVHKAAASKRKSKQMRAFLVTELAATRNQLAAQTNKVQQSLAQNDVLQQSLSESQKQAENLVTELHESNMARDAALNAKSEAAEELATLRATFNTQEAELASATAQCATLQEQAGVAAEQAKNNATGNKQVQKLQKRQDELQRSEAALTGQLAAERKKAETEQTLLSAAQQTVDSLQQQLAHEKEQLKDQTAALQTSREETAACRQELAQRDESINRKMQLSSRPRVRHPRLKSCPMLNCSKRLSSRSRR